MENEKQEQGLIVKDFSEMGVSQKSKQSKAFILCR